MSDNHQSSTDARRRARPSVSTIIPVWNELEALQTAIATTHDFLAGNFEDFEIIIVESGSTDGSAEACDQLAESMPSVEVIHEATANGFGSALKLGFARAAKDLVWAVSADLPFPLESLLTAVPLLADHDCVLSYRVDDERGWFRRCQSLLYNSLAKSLLGLDVRHVNSTFKVYRQAIIQRLPIKSDGWLIDTEIVFSLQRSQAKITEIPVPLIDRKAGRSTISVITPLLIFRDLVKFALAQRVEA